MTALRHFLDIRPRSARLACGPSIGAYFPMESKALDPSGLGKIDVTVQAVNVTCPRCIGALHSDGKTLSSTQGKS